MCVAIYPKLQATKCTTAVTERASEHAKQAGRGQGCFAEQHVIKGISFEQGSILDDDAEMFLSVDEDGRARGRV